MTKYEWETELKKNIHRLPPDEIKRVMEYYGELFDDHAERGKRETEIIYEFGNPVDVADKILAEFYAENGGEIPPPAAPPPVGERTQDGGEQRAADISAPPIEQENVAPESKDGVEPAAPPSDEPPTQAAVGAVGGKSGSRVAIFVLLNILTGGAFVIAAVAVWAVLAALVVAGAGGSLGGAYVTVISIGLTAVRGGAGVAQLGMGLAAAGAGIALTYGAIKLIGLCARQTKKLFARLGDWLTAKKERA